MKNRLVTLALLLTVSTSTLAIHPAKSSVQTRIADDGNTLTIQIDTQKNGHTTHYQHIFDVAGKNWVQKDWLKYRVFTNQGVMLPFHEMRGMLVVAGSLFLFFTALLLVGFLHRKSFQIR